jgi:hypothetical protein
VDEGVLEQQPKFRCSRCSHIFPHGRDDPAEDSGEELSTDSSASISNPGVDQEEETADPASSDVEDTEDTAISPSTPQGESLSFSFETDDSGADEPAETEPSEESASAATLRSW